MKYFTAKPGDEFGNVAYWYQWKYPVIAATEEGDLLRVEEPSDFKWPTVRGDGWFEIDKREPGGIGDQEWAKLVLAAPDLEVWQYETARKLQGGE